MNVKAKEKASPISCSKNQYVNTSLQVQGIERNIMHSIETSLVLFISFVCIVLLLQSTIVLHTTIKERSEKEFTRELNSHTLDKDKDFFKVELYTRFFSVAEDLLLRKKDGK